MTKRRLLSLILAICMVMSLVPTVAYAAGGVSGGNTQETHTVDFGTGSWTIGEQTVTADKNGKIDALEMNDEITLSGFHAETMQVRLEAGDGFATTLAVVDGKTSLAAKDAENLPDSILLFSVVAKQTGGQEGGNSEPGELRFTCQTNAVNGGSIYYKLNNTGDFTPVPVSAENDEYNSVSLIEATSIAIKFVANEGYQLDTTRGVTLRVDGTDKFRSTEENIAAFTSESGYTFNLSELVGDGSVSQSGFELEFGFEPESGIFPAKSFQVGFSPYGDEETAGKVEVQIGDGNAEFVQPWYDYAYDNGETPITFTLTPPAEAVDCTPFVYVVAPEFENIFEPHLQQSAGKYSFTITPNTLWDGDSEPSFVVLVFWSEFDAFGPEDGQFMVETNVPGGNAYGTILVQPGTDAHKSFGSLDKYLYDKGDSEGTLHVTLIPQPGKKLVAFQIGNEMYGYEDMGDSEEGVAYYPLPELTPDGQYTATIPIPKLSDTDDYIYVEAIFEPAAQTADFTTGDNGAAALALLNAAKTGTEESTWDSTTKVLTLKGVNFTTAAITAVKLPADSTVLLTEGTENIITSVNEGAGESCSYGIYAQGNLTVEGDGLLTATGGTAKGRHTHSCGIYAYEGNITVSGGAVNAIGGTTDNGSYGDSYGIFAGYDVIISDGTVYAAGGTADSDSYGIFAGYNVTITGGTVTTMGGKTRQTIAYSCGIFADVERVNGELVGGTVTIENSKVIATGGETVMSRGIQAYNTVTISQGADVTATGSTAEKYSTGIQADWDSVTIADSKVIATSNTASLGSNGIFTNGQVTITGSADVTATGGTVTRKQSNDDSRGIYADYVTIEGGTVRATGGEESIASYGICTDYDVTITGGTVIAKGRAAEMSSDGIYAKGDYDYYGEFVGGGNVTISGGTVTAAGDTAIRESSGIYAESSVTLSGTAHVTATGSNAEYFSFGIFVNLTKEGAGLTVSGGSLVAQASAEAESCAALSAEPDLTGYATYWWRTDAQGSYTEGNFVWNDDPCDTYVEITDTPSDPITYTITLDAGGGTVTTTSMTTGTDGKLTGALPTPTRDGYTFDGWFTAAEGGEEVTTDTVFHGNTTIYAHWTAMPTYPPIIEDTEGGTVTVSPEYPTAGSKVTITATPDEDYEVDQVIVTDQNGKPVAVTDNGDGTYSFTQPVGKATVKVVFKDAAAVAFVDVPTDEYYYNAVQWAVKNGITCGTSDTTFSPDTPCTRAQVVTFLWRAAGCPSPQSREMPFKDVAKGSYYETAVLWAVETGITQGTSTTTFSPEETCSRAQIVTFLWRSQHKPSAGTANPFTDVSEDSYYTEAVLWAVGNGITVGTSDTTFSPDEDCTRAQIVTFLYRCLGK